VGTRKSKLWVMTDRSRGGVGHEVNEFAPTVSKKIPNGACFSKDGFLYTVEQNRVLEYPAPLTVPGIDWDTYLISMTSAGWVCLARQTNLQENELKL
jgi:hypothetical protein